MKIRIFKNSCKNVSRLCEDVSEIYDCIMAITNDNHDEASNVQGWSDIACIGEIYEGENFTAICE